MVLYNNAINGLFIRLTVKAKFIDCFLSLSLQDGRKEVTRRAPLIDVSTGHCEKSVMVFFNKVDLLEEKLRNGVDVLKYIPELGSNPAYKDANFNEPLPPPEEEAEFERIVKLRKEAGLFGQIKLVDSLSYVIQLQFHETLV